MAEPYSPPVTVSQADAVLTAIEEIVFRPVEALGLDGEGRKEPTAAERLALIALALRPDLSNAETARLVGLSRNTVSRARTAQRLAAPAERAPVHQESAPQCVQLHQESAAAPGERGSVHQQSAAAPASLHQQSAPEPPESEAAPEVGCFVADPPPIGGVSVSNTAPDLRSAAPQSVRVPHRGLAMRVIEARRKAGFRGRPNIDRVAATCAELLENEITEVEIVEWAPRVKAFSASWIINTMNERHHQPPLRRPVTFVTAEQVEAKRYQPASEW